MNPTISRIYGIIIKDFARFYWHVVAYVSIFVLIKLDLWVPNPSSVIERFVHTSGGFFLVGIFFYTITSLLKEDSSIGELSFFRFLPVRSFDITVGKVFFISLFLVLSTFMISTFVDFFQNNFSFVLTFGNFSKLLFIALCYASISNVLSSAFLTFFMLFVFWSMYYILLLKVNLIDGQAYSLSIFTDLVFQEYSATQSFCVLLASLGYVVSIYIQYKFQVRTLSLSISFLVPLALVVYAIIDRI